MKTNQSRKLFYAGSIFCGMWLVLVVLGPKPQQNTLIQPSCEIHHSTPASVPSYLIPGKIHVARSNTNPEFYVMTTEDGFPRADGDEAQQYIIDQLQLKETCRKNPNTTVVDVGGCFGDFGLYAASLGCKVFIFEPLQLNYWLIKTSIELNGFSDRVHLYNYAISSGESTVTFRNEGGQTRQITYDDPGAGDPRYFSVKTTTLDKIIPTDEIFLLKVDVEGFEPTVLFEGSAQILKERRVRHLITEYTTWWTYDGKGPWNTFLPRIAAFADQNAQYYALDRRGPYVYSFNPSSFDEFHQAHSDKHLQTDVYVDFYGQGMIKRANTWNKAIYA